MTELLAFCSSIVVLLTVIARGADHPTTPRSSGPFSTFRLHAEKLALLLVGATAGAVLIATLAGLPVSAPTVTLMAGTALWMASHPSGWLHYITQGPTPDCDDARPDP